MSTNIETFMADLDGGTFEAKLGAMLSNVASAVIDYNEKGQVHVIFDMQRIGTSHQVMVNHTLKYKHATMHGNLAEENKTSTPMHVGSRGALSFFPEKQGQMFGKKGELAMGEDAFPVLKQQQNRQLGDHSNE